MAALQCDICGGKLIGRPGGIFECDSCGMQYDTAWAREKIQEIKGTVKVEGTVEVQGTVKIDGPIQVEGSISKDNLLERGNMALADGNWKEADDFFDQVLNLEPHSAQAYLGKYMAYMKAVDIASLKEIYTDANPLDVSHKLLHRTRAFADADISKILKELDHIRAQGQKMLCTINESKFEKASGLIHLSLAGLAVKTLSGSVHIWGHQSKITWNRNKTNCTSEQFPYSRKWDNVDRLYGGYQYASSCSGGLLNENAVAYSSSCFVAVDHAGKVSYVHVDKEKSIAFSRIIDKWENVDLVIASYDAVLAKTHDGTVYWVNGTVMDQKQNVVKDWQNVIHIALNGVGAYALTADGHVFCLPLGCLQKHEEMENTVRSWENITQIIVGEYFIAALTGSGDVKFASAPMQNEKAYEKMKSAVESWKHVKKLNAVNELTCVCEDGSAVNVHDGILPGDWSAAEKLYKDKAGYYGLAADGSVCVGQKLVLQEGVVKETGRHCLYQTGQMSGIKTKKKILDYVHDDWETQVAVLYEDGTVDVFTGAERSGSYYTDDWKVFQSSDTFLQEYSQYETERREKRENFRKEFNTRKEAERLSKYNNACRLLNEKKSVKEITEAKAVFQELDGYRDSREKTTWCEKMIQILEEIDRLRERRMNLEKEHANLGFFSGKRKKEIAAEILKMDNEIDKLEKERLLR